MAISESLLNVLYFVLIFLIGIFVGYVLNSFDSGVTGLVVQNPALPSDYLHRDDVLIYPDRIVLQISGAQLSTYDSTGSMLPTMGEETNGITIKPLTEKEINVGDIITFHDGEKLIVHRVIKKGIDEEGIYFITKGDNSLTDDDKIRFEEIERKVVGLIY
jgi:signal peptidase I